MMLGVINVVDFLRVDVFVSLVDGAWRSNEALSINSRSVGTRQHITGKRNGLPISALARCIKGHLPSF